MSGSTLNPNKKSRRGRPPVDSEQVGIRIERPLLEAMDAFAAAEADKPGRPEAIRRILTDDLTRRGFLQPSGGLDQGKRPDELDAVNDD